MTAIFKSVFSKYVAAMVVFISACFILFGGIQLWSSTRYWVEEKEESMSAYAQSVADLTSELISTRDGVNFVISDADLSRILRVAPIGLSDAEVLLVDDGGAVIMSSERGDSALFKKTLTSSKLWSPDVPFSITSMNDALPSNHYVASRPLMYESKPIGHVLVLMSADKLTDYLVENLRIFVMAMLAVLTLAVLAIYLMVSHWSRPLKQMAQVTRRFAVGDFSRRVPVRGKDETAELAEALNQMAVSLSSVEDMRRSFVGNVSHELKTPMTTIAGFVDGILDGTIPPDQQKKYLVLVSDEVKRLSRLVRTMLDLSRIDSGELKINPIKFDLTDVTYKMLLSFEKRIEDKHIEVRGLENCRPTEVVADPDLIAQVMYNLVDNAVKFTDDGGWIDISVIGDANRCHFTVRNSGAGIPPEEMPHVFERFYKTDKSRSLDRTGVGLGLYIVKNVINLHQGEIIVRSAAGEFTEFSFWLPMGKPLYAQDNDAQQKKGVKDNGMV